MSPSPTGVASTSCRAAAASFHEQIAFFILPPHACDPLPFAGACCPQSRQLFRCPLRLPTLPRLPRLDASDRPSLGSVSSLGSLSTYRISCRDWRRAVRPPRGVTEANPPVPRVPPRHGGEVLGPQRRLRPLVIVEGVAGLL